MRKKLISYQPNIHNRVNKTNWNYHLLMIVFISFNLFSLSSCSLFETADNAMEPTELVDVEEIVKLESLWSNDTGKGNNDALVKLKPVIINQQIIVIDRTGDISAYDRYKGTLLWQKKFDVLVTGGLAATDDMIFFSDDKADLYALSPVSGELLWKQKLTSIALSQVATSGNIVISRTIDGKIVGLDKKTGKQIWIYTREVPVLTFRGNSSPIVSNGVIYAGLDSGKVVAIVAENGRVLWEVAISYPKGRTDIERMVDIDGDPLIIGQQLFAISINGNVSAINIENGKVNWSRKLSSYVGLGFDDSHLYITDDKDNIFALGLSNGDIVWKLDKLQYRHLTAPTAVNNYILVADFDGYIHIIAKQTGALHGRERLDSDGYLVPALVRSDDVYWYGNSGKLDMFKIK